MNTLQKACLVITIIGALNWGFIGLLDINIIESVFGVGSVIARVIYSIVRLINLRAFRLLFYFNKQKTSIKLMFLSW